ncbi:hypothetical protein DAPPUDRAFT_266007 [Daphnia pulex]|uniref:Uncharacterized protein n=1 Tax=Daphnia pulex TaxID=6669 RepID=E9HUC2_DAPPU|nr:hypothetical protein DAPPUDRAFT_266007 [Daphnia pulex]|eukprot:EFX64659.1 hypothetical protein DAPPUDRAFT_266007 [Daphnia pulex]
MTSLASEHTFFEQELEFAPVSAYHSTAVGASSAHFCQQETHLSASSSRQKLCVAVVQFVKAAEAGHLHTDSKYIKPYNIKRRKKTSTMDLILVRAAWFILTGLIMSSLAMGRMTGNNVDGNEINDIFQPLPERRNDNFRFDLANGDETPNRRPSCPSALATRYAPICRPTPGESTRNPCAPAQVPADARWSGTTRTDIQSLKDQTTPTLRTCQRGMTAYTTVSLMSKSTGRMLSLNDVNHCICPGQSANYDLVDSQFDDVDDDTESMSTTYVCNPAR